MKIVQFNSNHISEALEIAKRNYEEERKVVSELPEDIKFPKLDYYAKNGLGVAAIEDGKLVGYLCVFEPWKGAFDTFDSLGTFSPLHANGVVGDNKIRIYQDMIEYAYEKWASIGIVTVGICLYAHDEESKKALFEYGFGMRLKDRIKIINKEEINSELTFKELEVKDFQQVRQMRIDLDNHLKKSPCFLQSTKEECEQWIKSVEEGDRRTFVAYKDSLIVGYIDVTDEGENFITTHPLMANICGAYCLPDYRGQNIMNDLLQYVSNILYDEGIRYLGVDHESYNPTANRFWNKYFKEYTNSVVKRIENWSQL